MWSSDHPDWVEKLAVFVGADYMGLQEAGTVSYITFNGLLVFLGGFNSLQYDKVGCQTNLALPPSILKFRCR